MPGAALHSSQLREQPSNDFIEVRRIQNCQDFGVRGGRESSRRAHVHYDRAQRRRFIRSPIIFGVPLEPCFLRGLSYFHAARFRIPIVSIPYECFFIVGYWCRNNYASRWILKCIIVLPFSERAGGSDTWSDSSQSSTFHSTERVGCAGPDSHNIVHMAIFSPLAEGRPTT